MNHTTTNFPKLVVIDYSPLKEYQPATRFTNEAYKTVVDTIVMTYPYGPYDTEVWERLEKAMDLSNLSEYDLQALEITIEDVRSILDHYMDKFFGKIYGHQELYAFSKFLGPWIVAFYYTGDLVERQQEY